MKKYFFLVIGVLAVSYFAHGAIFVAAQTLPDEIKISGNESWTGTLPSVSSLRIAGRIEYEKPAGANYTVEIFVNDKPVSSPLSNKGASFTYKDGRTFPYQSGNSWMLFYSNDFSANNSASGGGYQVVTDPGQAYLYRWDISALVGNSKTMKLTIKNNGKALGKPIIIKYLSKYPIAELGNCSDESSCRAYCGKQENYAVCADYGQKNNIISPEDAAKAKEFADVLKGEGPGACKDEKSCRSYCEGVAHLDECLSFAEKHNFVSADQLAEAKKVANALKAGATLPGGCTDKASCETYCKDASHIDECFSFAKKAGFMSEQEAAEAEKVIPLIKNGEAPGGCATKKSCQNYCDDSSHAVECVNFAEKAGFATKEEADIVRKTGGVGPGGCRSKDSCEAYCNKKENQQSCFDFAQKYDLIPADKLKEMKEGMGRLRSGLDQMPSEAISCLKDALGENIIGEIQSGNFTPGPQAGEIIKSCFDKVLPQLQAKLQEGLNNADETTLKCLKDGVGEDKLGKIKGGEAPEPEDGDVLRKCFESMKIEGMKKLREGLGKIPPEMKSCIEDKLGVDKVKKIESGENVDIGPEIGSMIQECVKAGQGALEQKMQEGLKSAPPEIRDCIQSKLGDVSEKMKSGELKGESDIQKLIQECISGFKPQGIPSRSGAPEGMGISGDKESLEKLREQYKDMQQGSAPSGSAAPAPPTGFVPGAEICAQFAGVPSCSYVPGSAKDICEKCKGE